MSAFWTGTPNGKNAEVCAFWYDLSHDANEELAAHAEVDARNAWGWAPTDDDYAAAA